MLHLWSVATWNLEVTQDAGQPEWLDTPITSWTIESLESSAGNSFDGEKWTVRLSKPLHLLTAWHMDEPCDQLYLTCIDPRGKTLMRLFQDIEPRDDISRILLTSIALPHLWYTEDGLYEFTIAYVFDGLPWQRYGSVRLRLMQGE